MKSCLAAIRATKAVKALAHITGGGFPDNIPRVLPADLGVTLGLARVPVQPVFRWLAETGKVGESEMLRTFNCGIGMIAIVDASQSDAIVAALTQAGETVIKLGTVTPVQDTARVAYSGRLDLAW